jgi:3D (Asp-Asp-Asp) domain-containing protein
MDFLLLVNNSGTFFVSRGFKPVEVLKMDEENPLPLTGKGVREKAMLFMAFSALLLSIFLLAADNPVFPPDYSVVAPNYAVVVPDYAMAGPDNTVAGLDYTIVAPDYYTAAPVQAVAGPDYAVQSAYHSEISSAGVEEYLDVAYAIEESTPRRRGYKENTLPSRSGYNFDYVRSFYVGATAYCPGTPGSGCPLDEQGRSLCTGSYNDGYTATGSRAAAGDGSLENPHIIAVDPAVIPLYSLIYLEGYGFARALDRGGAIRGLRIDILFDRHADAVKFGRRQVKVYLFP